MTKKDYVLIAKTLKKVRDCLSLDDGYYIINEFQKILKKENTRFDYKKFESAIYSIE